MSRQPTTFEEALDMILQEMREVMIERQKKYGPDNIKRLGVLGVLDRAQHDKMARLRRYYEREELRRRCLEAGMPEQVVDQYLPSYASDYSDESLDDAHLDAANYVGVIALMLRRGWWGLPLESEGRTRTRGRASGKKQSASTTQQPPLDIGGNTFDGHRDWTLLLAEQSSESEQSDAD